LSVVGHIAEVFARLGIVNDCAARDINITVFAICSCATAGPSVASVTGENMTLEAEVQKRPIVVVASQIHMASAPTIAAIRSAIGNVFGTMHVHGTSATFTRTAAYLDVIYEVAFCHLTFTI
jgi:hypothetical protein